eukprot:555604-Amphidinium_carterae.1
MSNIHNDGHDGAECIASTAAIAAEGRTATAIIEVVDSDSTTTFFAVALTLLLLLLLLLWLGVALLSEDLMQRHLAEHSLNAQMHWHV